jgi:hypothetical protein
MPAEISQFLIQHGMLLIAALTVIACTVAVQWRKARQAESAGAFLADLLSNRTSTTENDWILLEKAIARKGLLEQFAAVSNAGKFVLLGMVALSALGLATCLDSICIGDGNVVNYVGTQGTCTTTLTTGDLSPEAATSISPATSDAGSADLPPGKS